MKVKEFEIVGSKLKCPYCGELQDDTDFYPEESLWECQSCEKLFEVEVEYEPIYGVRKRSELIEV